MWFLPDNSEFVARGWGFYLAFTFEALLLSPALILVYVNLCIDFLFMYIFGFLYALFACRLGKYSKASKALEPYRYGPPLITHLGDAFVAASGMCFRMGVGEMSMRLTIMFFLNPWIKYWMIANPFLYDLEERFITQISTSMKDLPLEDVKKEFRHLLTSTKIRKSARQEVDDMFFVPRLSSTSPASKVRL